MDGRVRHAGGGKRRGRHGRPSPGEIDVTLSKVGVALGAYVGRLNRSMKSTANLYHLAHEVIRVHERAAVTAARVQAEASET